MGPCWQVLVRRLPVLTWSLAVTTGVLKSVGKVLASGNLLEVVGKATMYGSSTYMILAKKPIISQLIGFVTAGDACQLAKPLATRIALLLRQRIAVVISTAIRLVFRIQMPIALYQLPYLLFAFSHTSICQFLLFTER